MCTVSMRPYCPNKAVNKAVNFVQERLAWVKADFDEPVREAAYHAAGLIFHVPMQSVDITVPQLACMFAGLDAAYEQLCEDLYAEADKHLAKTQWRNLQNFMEYVPEPLEDRSPFIELDSTEHMLPLPILYDAGSGLALGWTYGGWRKIDAPQYIGSWDSAGTCFGWEVRFDEGVMSTECMRDPHKLVTVLVDLLGALAYPDTDAKRYVASIYLAH